MSCCIYSNMEFSLCMIVKNEEKMLGRCLHSVRDIFDEIIIVDTGSEDATKEIARMFTDKVYDFKWVNNFSTARNFSFSKATKDYIMWLDADDIMEEKQRQKLLEAKQTFDSKVDVAMLKYNVQFDEMGNSTFSYYRERIVKNDKTFYWKDPVHEAITPHGNIVYLDIAVSHKKEGAGSGDRNLKIYQSLLAKGVVLSARQRFYYARELMYNSMFEDAIEEFEKFLQMPEAWKENKIECCVNLSTCYEHLGKKDAVLMSLFRSFLYDTPRAVVMCDIGDLFFNRKEYKSAAFWYSQASKQEDDMQSGAFVNPDKHKFIPYIQMCVCYYRLGDIKRSKYYNDKAYKIKPYDNSVLSNKKFFEKLSKKK